MSKSGMNKSRMQFWDEAVCAAVQSGRSAEEATEVADALLEARDKRAAALRGNKPGPDKFTPAQTVSYRRSDFDPAY